MNKAVFLDRDGTINIEKNYLYKADDWEWIEGSVEAIKGFNRLGYLVIVITNQAGVARGLYNCKDVDRLHDYVNRLLEVAGAKIDGYYYCPHHPGYGEVRDCDCRKPKAGLLFKAQAEHAIDLKNSYMIGDKASDILAGYEAGVTSILVTTGYGLSELGKINEKTLIAENLFHAYRLIVARGITMPPSRYRQRSHPLGHELNFHSNHEYRTTNIEVRSRQNEEVGCADHQP